VEDPAAEGYFIAQPTPQSYLLSLSKAVELSYFGRQFNVPADGNCGFSATLKATILANKSEGSCNPTLEHWDRQGFAGVNFFRKSLKSFYDEYYIQIVDPDDPIFLNDVGQANPNFVVKYVDGSEVKNCVKYNGQRCNRVEWKADRIYNSEYSAELLESQQQIVGRMFWMEPNFVLP
jgi:hypothetical protein